MKVHSIFASLNGEVTSAIQGSLAVFVRLAGCNLRCSYCDSIEARDGLVYKEMSIEEVITKIKSYGLSNLTITGGEPLLQKGEVFKLCSGLRDFHITLETNGSIPLDTAFLYTNSIVADFKLPGSGYAHNMDMTVFEELFHRDYINRDYIKFVITNYEDFVWAKKIVESMKYPWRPRFAFSPAMGLLPPKVLLDWMLEAKLKNCIFNAQIHKLIGNDIL